MKKFFIVFIVLAAVILIGFLAWRLDFQKEQLAQVSEPEKNMDNNKIVDGLKTEILQEGAGPLAKSGDTVEAHYTGYLENGDVFDSSIGRGQPFSFTLGAGQVIKGWDLGIVGMKIGEKRKLTIPPELGYGAAGVPGVILPNAILIFEIELMAIK